MRHFNTGQGIFHCNSGYSIYFILIQWSMTLHFIKSQWNMLYPVWKCLAYRSLQLSYYKIESLIFLFLFLFYFFVLFLFFCFCFCLFVFCLSVMVWYMANKNNLRMLRISPFRDDLKTQPPADRWFCPVSIVLNNGNRLERDGTAGPLALGFWNRP